MVTTVEGTMTTPIFRMRMSLHMLQSHQILACSTSLKQRLISPTTGPTTGPLRPNRTSPLMKGRGELSCLLSQLLHLNMLNSNLCTVMILAETTLMTQTMCQEHLKVNESYYYQLVLITKHNCLFFKVPPFFLLLLLIRQKFSALVVVLRFFVL